MKQKHKKNEMKKFFLKKKAFKHLKRKLLKKRKYKLLLNKGKIINTKKIVAPKIFSISKNSDETLEILERIKTHCSDSNKKVLLDMREIEKVDIDVLMYLKYIVYEIKVKKMKKCVMSFIPPKNKILRKFIHSTGFVSYYKRNRLIDNFKEEFSQYKKENSITSGEEGLSFKIKHGTTIDRFTEKNIVDFTKKNIDRKGITFLYNMLSEMMENTKLHAYTDTDNIEHKDWFIFAEKINNRIAYVFLDVGLGITETIKRKISDTITWKTKSKMLLSALKGEKRTRTKKVYRGKGLPYIFTLQSEGKIKNLRIISNNACFNLNDNEDIRKELKGTFFYWEIEGENK